jgi:hypothetical protein
MGQQRGPQLAHSEPRPSGQGCVWGQLTLSGVVCVSLSLSEPPWDPRAPASERRGGRVTARPGGADPRARRHRWRRRHRRPALVARARASLRPRSHPLQRAGAWPRDLVAWIAARHRRCHGRWPRSRPPPPPPPPSPSPPHRPPHRPPPQPHTAIPPAPAAAPMPPPGRDLEGDVSRPSWRADGHLSGARDGAGHRTPARAVTRAPAPARRGSASLVSPSPTTPTTGAREA